MARRLAADAHSAGLGAGDRLTRGASASAASLAELRGRASASLEPRGELLDEETPLPTPLPFHLDSAPTLDVELPARPAAPAIMEPPAAASASAPESSGRFFLWSALIGLSVAAALGAVYTQSDFFHPERAQRGVATAPPAPRARRRGRIVIESQVPGAAVWLWLGNTPTTSMPLATSQVHELPR